MVSDPSESFVIAQQSITTAARHMNLQTEKDRKAFIKECRWAAAVLLQAAELAEKKNG
jgi:hypothetical protein